MSTPAAPPLKSTAGAPDGPRAAEPAPPPQAVGVLKDVARQGVPTAVGSDPDGSDGRYPVAWLHISVPRYGVPTATSMCLCGRDRSAVGHGKVHALIADHTAHREACLLRTNQEGRAAA